MGTAVIGGMVAETFIGRFFVPAIFYFVERLSPADRARVTAPAPQHGAITEGHQDA
jgi:HAE1 family hydrophobic/amphiphilic exporter-1